MSQEELAERINISVTHMSHIETGNTKLSLPVLVALSESLEVKVDELLCNNSKITTTDVLEEIAAVLDSCTTEQAKIILDTVKSLKLSMDKYM